MIGKVLKMSDKIKRQKLDRYRSLVRALDKHMTKALSCEALGDDFSPEDCFLKAVERFKIKS